MTFLLSSFGGFLINHLLTKPGSYMNKRLPNISIKIIEFLPSIKINLRNRTIHIHHWLGYTFLLVITITFSIDFLSTLYAKGYFVGSIVQGLTYPDWKNIIKNKSEIKM